jgi:hypothetical protein
MMNCEMLCISGPRLGVRGARWSKEDTLKRELQTSGGRRSAPSLPSEEMRTGRCKHMISRRLRPFLTLFDPFLSHKALISRRLHPIRIKISREGREGVRGIGKNRSAKAADGGASGTIKHNETR